MIYQKFREQTLSIIGLISYLSNNLVTYIEQEKMEPKINIYYTNLGKYININFQLYRCIGYYESSNKAQLARLIDWCRNEVQSFEILPEEIDKLIDILREDVNYGRYYSKRLR